MSNAQNKENFQEKPDFLQKLTKVVRIVFYGPAVSQSDCRRSSPYQLSCRRTSPYQLSYNNLNIQVLCSQVDTLFFPWELLLLSTF